MRSRIENDVFVGGERRGWIRPVERIRPIPPGFMLAEYDAAADLLDQGCAASTMQMAS
jgi:hypothetical protein